MKDALALENSSGFTLLELLLAIFIFGVVVSSVYGAYTSTFMTIKSAEFETEINQRARTALERIAEDLEALHMGSDGLMKGESQEIDSRRSDKLEFTSTAHVTFTQKEAETRYATIRYSVEADSDTGLMLLYRADVPALPGKKIGDDEKGFLLCDNLWEVSYRYFDSSGSEMDEWDTVKLQSQGVAGGKVLPVMVEISLRFANATADEAGSLFTTAVAMGKVD